MNKLFTSFLAILLLASATFAEEITASLRKISDGDTMTFHNSKGEIKCRVYGIDTPEKFKTAKFKKDMSVTGMSEKDLKSLGEAATDYAKQRLHISSLYKVDVLEKDKYGRSLCIIYLNDSQTYNEKIVEDGYAVVYKKGKYTKDSGLRHSLNQAQGRAVNKEAGLWRNHKNFMTEMADH